MSSYFTVIVPSKGRPQSVKQFMEAFMDTKTDVRTRVAWAIDEDDPTFDDYLYELESYFEYEKFTVPSWMPMVPKLNLAASFYAETSDFIGFMGDDHRPRTLGWDSKYIEAMNSQQDSYGSGMVYGDDLIWGSALPTQIAMTSNIVKKLEYMVHPSLSHMFCDDFWRDLGRKAHILKYLPDVIVEHVHPLVGKAETDETYQSSAKYMTTDKVAYEFYLQTQFNSDVIKIKELRNG